MQVLAVDEGGLCALSPNKSLYAIVKNSLTVIFIDYIRRTSALLDDIPPNNNTNHHHYHYYKSSAIISKHSALDEVEELQWSPDNTLVALLLPRLKLIEVVSIYGKCCVARVEAGVAGLRALHWHPSSRVIYWAGLLQAHLLSLIDSAVMRIAGGVKYSAQLVARRRVLSSINNNNNNNNSSRNSNIRGNVLDSPLSEAALLRFSMCKRFIFYVTPKSSQSPLVMHSEVAQGVLESKKEMIPIGVAESDREKNENENIHSSSTNLRSRSEWLVVISATTHEELHAFPTNNFVLSVSDIIPLQGGIALVDYLHGSLSIITFNGSTILHHENSGVKNVISSKNGDIIFIVFIDSCRSILVSSKRVLALRHISFKDDVILSVQLQQLQVMEEAEIKEGSSNICESYFHNSTNISADKTLKRNEDILKLFNNNNNNNNCVDCMQGEILNPSQRSYAAISASSKLAAVKFEKWPLFVLIIDILRQRVLTILHYQEPVINLCWSPFSSSKFWRFQRRHYMNYGKDEKEEQEDQIKNGKIKENSVSSNNTTTNSTTTTTTTSTTNTTTSTTNNEEVTLGLDEPLIINTDNHDGKFFLWIYNHALCFSASYLFGSSTIMMNDIENEKKQGKRRCLTKCNNNNNNNNNNVRNTLSALRINRVMFGDDAADAVLVDDLREIALTVAFKN